MIDTVATLWRDARYRGDREFFIRRAIGWAVRSYAWLEPDAVVAYCDTHALSPLSRREALKNVAT